MRFWLKSDLLNRIENDKNSMELFNLRIKTVA